MSVALVNERRVFCPNGRPNKSTEASMIRKDAGLNPICFSHLVINHGMELKMKRYVEVQVWFAAVELVPGLRCLSSCCSRVSVVSKRPVSRIYQVPQSKNLSVSVCVVGLVCSWSRCRSACFTASASVMLACIWLQSSRFLRAPWCRCWVCSMVSMYGREVS
jgi:hypothetical protein